VDRNGHSMLVKTVVLSSSLALFTLLCDVVGHKVQKKSVSESIG